MAVLNRIATPSTAGIRNLTPSFAIVRSLHFATAAAATATAQLQLDHDGDYDYRQSPASVAEVDTDNLSPIRGIQWVFIGNPKAKKHIYAHMVSKLLQVPRISISTLLRQDLNPHSPLYRKIADAINCGKPVPESIIFGLLSKRLDDGHYRGENGFILDGIPRTRLQAEILDELVDIDLVVNFKCSEDHFEMAGSPADSTAACGRSKSSLSGLNRTDENSELMVNAFYREQMQFLETYYQNQNKLIDFQVGDAPGDNWKGLIAALHLQHINAVHSSKTLTMNFRIP